MATCYTASPCAPRVALPAVMKVYCACASDIGAFAETEGMETLGATGTVAIAASFARTEATETLLADGTNVAP